MTTRDFRIVARGIPAMWHLRGPSGLAAALVRKLYWRKRFVRFAVPLAEWRNDVAPRPGTSAREGTLAELARFRAGRRGLAHEFFLDQTHGARRFYLGFADGQVGHISWVFTRDDVVRHMRLAPDEIMLDGAYTFPESRGRSLLATVERAILDDARREGWRTAYTHVTTDNGPSLRGVWKTGFRPVGLLTWRWILGVCLTSYVPLEGDGGPRRAPQAPRARTLPGEPVARLDSAPGFVAGTRKS